MKKARVVLYTLMPMKKLNKIAEENSKRLNDPTIDKKTRRDCIDRCFELLDAMINKATIRGDIGALRGIRQATSEFLDEHRIREESCK